MEAERTKVELVTGSSPIYLNQTSWASPQQHRRWMGRDRRGGHQDRDPACNAKSSGSVLSRAKDQIENSCNLSVGKLMAKLHLSWPGKKASSGREIVGSSD